MRYAGFAFLAAALTFVFHAYLPGSFDPDRMLPDDFRSASPAEVAVTTPPARNFALGAELTLKSRQERAALRHARAVESAAPVAVAILPTAMPVVSSETTRPTPEPMSALAPQDDAGRAVLVRNIKRELRRVGCFYGRIDDDWDESARGAAESFMDRVNATLPNTPDHVLLALVRNHKSGACSDSCPRGQAMSSEGRCMPNAIVAKMNRGSAGSAEARKPAAATEPFTTTVTVAEVQTTAAKAPASVEIPDRMSKRSPLPGRMVMGAAGSGNEAAGNWWDDFMSPTSPSIPQKEQTLDRPVGLTHTPTPRPAQRAAPGEGEMRTASVSDDGPALQPAGIALQPLRERAERPLRTKPYRAQRTRSARPRSARGRYARRWSGRNVQSMFQHPLGRM